MKPTAELTMDMQATAGTRCRAQRRGQARRRGSTLIEFALVAPVLLLITLGIIQYGIIFNATNSVSQITREGARAAAVFALKRDADPPAGAADDIIRERVRIAADNASLRRQDITSIIIEAPNGRAVNQQIKVTVTYDLRKKFIIPALAVGMPQSYTRTATMMIE